MTAISWPTELRLNPAKDALTRRSSTMAQRFALAAEYLRVESPSAEVHGHGGGTSRLVTGKENVKIAAPGAGGQLRRAHRLRRRP